MSTTTFNHSIFAADSNTVYKPTVFHNLITWCEGQQENRFLWLGISLAFHGCVSTPITIFMVILAGANMILFVTALSAMAMALVTNLAAMPTKITIPVLLLSILVDIAVICTATGMGVSSVNAFLF